MWVLIHFFGLRGVINGKAGKEAALTKFSDKLTLSRDLRETIESGPLCITDLFQNKSVAYF